MESIYSTDPRAKTPEGFIAGLEILARYMEKGLQTKWFMGGEHDVIYIYVSLDDLTPESEDGQMLQRLGFTPNEETWGYTT
jgi:hypothetical protein